MKSLNVTRNLKMFQLLRYSLGSLFLSLATFLGSLVDLVLLPLHIL